MSRRWRVAICGLANESCTFSPLTANLDDIRVDRGAPLLVRHPYVSAYPEGEFVPLMRAYSLPGGPWAPDVYDALLAEIVTLLHEQGPWDGVLLDVHGALGVRGREDAEAHLIAAVRAAVGPGAILGASYDLHGNVSPQVLAGLDVLSAYRTAPHIDDLETRERAASLLLRCLREGRRPAKALVSLPLGLPGERVMTTHEPARSLYARLPAVAQGSIWDASLLVGYIWADEPRVGASAVVLADDQSSAAAAAHDLAQSWWAQREAFQFGQETGSVDECIDAALANEQTPVFISDAGDNVTGGGAGDVPFVLRRLLARKIERALYTSIADATAVAACRSIAPGATVSLSLGGKLDPLHGSPLECQATLVSVQATDWAGDVAVVQIDGVTAVLTAQRCAFTDPEQFTELGLRTQAYDLVVVKLGYLFDRIQPLAARSLLAFSPGCIDPDVTRLPFERIHRPMYPLDPAMAWRPEVMCWPGRPSASA